MIYEISVLRYRITITESGWPDYGSEERVGYYFNKETAIKAVEENWADIQDHVAEAALIRPLKEGLYPFYEAKDLLYFIWNEDEQRFVAAKLPDLGDCMI